MEVIKVRSLDEFLQITEQLAVAFEYEKTLSSLCRRNSDELLIPGFCACCEKEVDFQLDFKYSNGFMPNYRERLLCPSCKLNNRQRLIVAKTKQLGKKDSQLFMYECITPIYKQISALFDNVIGSEYISNAVVSGTIVNGTMHQDAENLSFHDSQFDLLISNDVFEHVFDLKKAFSEAFRTLRPKGTLLFTIPFYHSELVSDKRAVLNDMEVTFLKTPQYHGNPMSSQGSLVVHDFGWDIIDSLLDAGFSDAYANVVYDVHNGNIGITPWNGILGAPMYFIADK